jgi:23S rRNA (cytidine1920-2'-O)/16S rRNA (cytidine1409-2'-O)-methyltransferase
MTKMRLDALLVERGMAESRAQAQALIMAGQVRVNGEVALKPGTAVSADGRLEVEHGPRFVSRGGDKLEAALSAFGVHVRGVVCADVGASTGGFADCLLQRGAERVYAIDVGKGILHWKLRQDPRVRVMEQTNARFVQELPEAVGLVTIDASFISLRVLLPVVRKWLRPIEGGDEAGIVALIKPQFEAGREAVARGRGVIRDAELHRQILAEILEFAASVDLRPRGLLRSPLVGPKGNAEFLVWLTPGRGYSSEAAAGMVDAAIGDAAP